MLASLADIPVPVRRFDADCMTLIPECRSIIDALSLVENGGAQWAHHIVTLWFDGPAPAWVLLYQFPDVAPYFDFAYSSRQPPQQALAALLSKYPQCKLLDWSPGHLVCIEAVGMTLEVQAEMIGDFAETVWALREPVITASYEVLGRA
ncbi:MULTISPECIES: hypothetical protein [Pseudomonas]|jgi:hypothetical protein|uniref:hypothetical protein n=1 Tax=Pseudomonas TaxID=286 RepID=UPI001E39F7E6|nr:MULTISPECIES: hypothetical protein [Pseudomonas]MCE1113905.1 hypothetical protein [Pseudomonas sp. NMI795_08]